jgi:hypothetical protein
MQYIEYAQAVLQAFSEYADYIVRTEDKSLYLELYYDGSGNVRDEDTRAILFKFNNLKELLVYLLVIQLRLKNIPLP